MKLTSKEAKAMGIKAPKRKPFVQDGKRKGRCRDNKTGADAKAKMFDAACDARGLPRPIHEYEFHRGRKWRFDFCWPDWDIALEVQGGLFVQGRHNQGAAMLQEHEKLNAAALDGWFVLYTTPKDVESGKVFELLGEALKP